MLNDRKLQDNNYNYHQQNQTNTSSSSRNFSNLYNEGNMINSELVIKYLYVCIFE
jgi:hypothetical protein